MEQLFVVTRRDLSPGAQAAQCLHAFRQFVEEHPTVERSWFTSSNTIILKAVENEDELQALYRRAYLRDFAVSSFREPDFSDALTAIALEPKGRALVRSIPLALV